MKFGLKRHDNMHEGVMVYLQDEAQRTLAIIDGNSVNHRGPVVLTQLDQFSVFGLSHPYVTARILASGPQTLMTSQELATKLFTGGMSASLGTVRIGNNTFQTTLETFYKLSSESKYLEVVTAKSGNQIGIMADFPTASGHKRYLLAHEGFKPAIPLPTHEFLAIDQIKNLEIEIGNVIHSKS